MGWIFFAIAAVLFFLGAVDSTIIPKPMSWGFVSLAVGFLVGNYIPTWTRK